MIAGSSDVTENLLRGAFKAVVAVDGTVGTGVGVGNGGGVGAQPSDSVRSLLIRSGIVERPPKASASPAKAAK